MRVNSSSILFLQRDWWRTHWHTLSWIRWCRPIGAMPVQGLRMGLILRVKRCVYSTCNDIYNIRIGLSLPLWTWVDVHHYSVILFHFIDNHQDWCAFGTCIVIKLGCLVTMGMEKEYLGCVGEFRILIPCLQDDMKPKQQHTATIHNLVNLKRESLKLVKEEEGGESRYHIRFNLDSKVRRFQCPISKSHHKYILNGCDATT